MIDVPYLHFTRIEILKTGSGRIYCHPLWAKDLKLHLTYISRFRLCCPVVHTNEIEALEDITDCGIEAVFPLRKDYGLKSVLTNLVPNLIGVMKACKGANIVQSGGGGWAFPLSFYLLFLRPFFRFQWIISIESSFWMVDKGDRPTARRFIEHHLHRILLTRCVKRANARIFTQPFYRQYFLKQETERTLTAPATWVDSGLLTTPETVKQKFSDRAGETLKFLFPARLVKDKGVQVVFDAVERLSGMGVEAHVTVMGTGDLEEDCKRFASRNFGTVKVSFRPPAEYGQSFFGVLREHDMVLVPNLKQEQPRIVFDAFSQGVGVIASDTSGNLHVTKDGRNAVIVKCGDAQSLAEAMRQVAGNPSLALEMGLAGLEYAQRKTHLQMHLERQRFLEEVLTVR